MFYDILVSVIENRDVAAAESIMKDYEERRCNTHACFDHPIIWKKKVFFLVLYEEYSHQVILKHVLIFVSKLAKTVANGENVSTVLPRKYENKQ
jgi:hypothetical protein